MEFYYIYKGELTTILLKLFQKSEEKETQRECGDKKAERSGLGRPCKVGTGGAGKAAGVTAHSS